MKCSKKLNYVRDLGGWIVSDVSKRTLFTIDYIGKSAISPAPNYVTPFMKKTWMLSTTSLSVTFVDILFIK
ncbi:MAG: hypothetical protein LVQ96_01870 [Thermoplasmatales archaeon]|nr:hypothetical protein [Thermoplasmatales archaeon]MCW6169900.1 hypothetical protein [Thermoplasmatales archaeon]